MRLCARHEGGVIMSTKNSILAMAQRMAQQLVAEQTKARIALGADAAAMAANAVFHMGPSRAPAFAAAYSEALDELAGLYIEDGTSVRDGQGNRISRMEYATEIRDEKLRRIVGEKNFVPFNKAYGEIWVDELKRIRVMQGQGALPLQIGDRVWFLYRDEESGSTEIYDDKVTGVTLRGFFACGSPDDPTETLVYRDWDMLGKDCFKTRDAAIAAADLGGG